MVKFYLPGLFEFFSLYTHFIDIFQQENFKFRKCEIGAVYGAPPDTLWNGGRIRGQGCLDVNLVHSWSQATNTPCALTFTNCLLDPVDLDNIYCNRIAQLFESDKNAIILHSELLENYIRETYPQYKIVSSTTKCITNVEQMHEEFAKDYERVVLDYNFNKNLPVLKSIEQKEKCEILINAVCYANCPRRAEHYRHIAATAKRVSLPEFECDAMNKTFHEALKNPNSITVEEIYNIYEPLGFHHYKIEGRTTNVFDLAEILVYYMVLPEYQMEIRQRLIAPFI